MENRKEVGGTERKANAGDVFLDELLRVDADHFAVCVEQWTAAVAGVDGGVGLNPGAGAGVGELADGADDALGDAEEHGVAGIADGQNIFALAHS